MLSQSILITAVLGSPPGSPPTDVVPPDFSERLHSVDVSVSDTDVVLDALDSTGEPIGSIAMWVDKDGTTWIASDYEDGHMLVAINPETGTIIREGGLAAEVAAERASAIADIAADQSQLDHSWGECGWKAAQAGGACFFARPFACVFGSVRAACACVPKIVEEFEAYECPWGL